MKNPWILNFDHLAFAGDFPTFYSYSFAERLDEYLDRELISDLRRSLNTVFLDSTRELDVAKLASLFQLVSKLVVTQMFKQSQFDGLQVFYLSLRAVKNIDLSFVSEFKSLYLFHLDSPPSLASGHPQSVRSSPSARTFTWSALSTATR